MTRQIGLFTMMIVVAAAYVGWKAWTVHQANRDWPVMGHDGTYAEVSLKSLASFPLSERSTDAEIPAGFRALDGRLVVFDQGLEMPCPSDTGTDRVRSFWLYDEHGWGGGLSEVRLRVLCTFPEARPLTLESDRRGRAYGKLHVGIRRDDDGGQITSVYRMDVDRVVPE